MKRIIWIGFLVLAAGCGQSPAPTGPAAEATTPDIEVSMPGDTENPSSPG
jgi:hypothetical protein